MHLDNLAEQFYTKQKGQDIFTDRKDTGNNLLLNQIKNFVHFNFIQKKIN